MVSLRSTLLFSLLLALGPAPAGAEEPRQPKRILVIYPESDNKPGTLLFDQGLRAALESSPEKIELYNEYLDTSRFPDDAHTQQFADFLERKYSSRKFDVAIAGLMPSLEFLLKYRQTICPGAPIIYAVIEETERARLNLESNIIGVPMRFDLLPTLELALRLHPGTKNVIVVSGASKYDQFWEQQARQAFQQYSDRLSFQYWSGLFPAELLDKTANLPSNTIIYYLHVFNDRFGNAYTPATFLETLSEKTTVPIYGHVETYLGRGIVGGSLMSFSAEGKTAGKLTLALLAGEDANALAAKTSAPNNIVVDWRQLQRWDIINEGELPPGTLIHFEQPSFWDMYKWHALAVISLCIVEALLIAGLLLQGASRRKAERNLYDSNRELAGLTSKLLHAQETERQRVARELHDDLNQNLGLLSVELDLLGQNPPKSGAELSNRLHEFSSHIKQLSSWVHVLSHQLHPAKVEQLGLMAALKSLCNELNKSHDLAIEFVDESVPASIPTEIALCCYRIAQESLRNVIKHSSAKHAKVELQGGPEELVMSVSDDGVGFDMMGDHDKGLGLLSMRERVRLVQGRMSIDSFPERGTRIEVHVPLTGTAVASENGAVTGAAREYDSH